MIRPRLAVKASVIKMNSPYAVSIHAMEKHLNPYNVHASVFFNQRIMHDSIRECLNQPDVTIVCGKRYELTKSFTSDIGVMAYSSRSNNTIRMVYTKTKIALQTMKCFEIAAYCCHTVICINGSFWWPRLTGQ